MEQLSYSNSNNNVLEGGFLGLGFLTMFTGSFPFIFAMLSSCSLCTYLCNNSKNVFKKSTEEYFIYFLLGLMIFEGIALYGAVNYPEVIPPPVVVAIYVIGAVFILVMCFMSC